MKKPKYIKKIERDGEVLSVLNLYSLPYKFEKFIDGLKTTIVYSVGRIDYEDVVFKYNKKIYKTAQGFYIYLSLRGVGNPVVTIYYKQEQLNEITIFVRGLLKQFKNATTDIRGNQTKN
jgi:hypothetical protein